MAISIEKALYPNMDEQSIVWLRGDIGTEINRGVDRGEKVVLLEAWDQTGTGNENISIAIPLRDARKVLDDLQKKIKVALREQDLQNDGVVEGIGEDYNGA